MRKIITDKEMSSVKHILQIHPDRNEEILTKMGTTLIQKYKLRK